MAPAVVGERADKVPSFGERAPNLFFSSLYRKRIEEMDKIIFQYVRY
ncbi:hypothetical protein V1478_009393 [Vespula squamosa]|uniref:Uncharacterized protein n=1 Tax=Vespula squamosa TaxID=30214 RepID=A0ABD2ARK5_VESSQ